MCGNRKEISWFLPTGHPHAGTPFFLLLRNQPSLCLLLNEKNWATATCSVLFFLFALSYLVFVPLKNIPVAVTCIAVLSCHSSPLQQIFSRFYRFASIFSIYGPRTQRDFRVLLGLRAVERNWPRTCSWRTRTDRFHSFVTIKKGGWVIFCWIGKWKFSQGSSASVGAGGTRAKKKNNSWTDEWNGIVFAFERWTASRTLDIFRTFSITILAHFTTRIDLYMKRSWREDVSQRFHLLPFEWWSAQFDKWN